MVLNHHQSIENGLSSSLYHHKLYLLCWYLVRLTFETSTVWYKSAKNKGFDGGVPVASPMLKFEKGRRRRKMK